MANANFDDRLRIAKARSKTHDMLSGMDGQEKLIYTGKDKFVEHKYTSLDKFQ